MHHHARIVGVGIALLAVGAVILAALPQQRPQSPTFRSRITLVPVDVRVLDADGKPITGLKLEDFTLLEEACAARICGGPVAPSSWPAALVSSGTS